jgi:hypothetical protein
MGGFGYSYKTIEDKVRFHRARAQHHDDRARFHEERAIEWGRILSQIQELQRLEQRKADSKKLDLAKPVRTTDSATRNDFAREVLRKHQKDGVLPREVRRLANQQGFPAPNNYPYKLFTLLVKQGKARKDAAGRYYPTEAQ